MITSDELELFEDNIKDNNYGIKQSNKILKEIFEQIQMSEKFTENDLDNWSDYSAWDNWDRTA